MGKARLQMPHSSFSLSCSLSCLPALCAWHPSLDDLLRAFRAKAPQDFELFALGLIVGDEKMLDLIQQILAQLSERLHLPVITRFSGDCNETVITYRLAIFNLFGFDHADQPHRDKAADKSRFVYEHQDIQCVAVFASRLRDEDEGEGKDGARWEHAAEFEKLILFVVLEFVATASRRVNDDVDFTALTIECSEAGKLRSGLSSCHLLSPGEALSSAINIHTRIFSCR